MWESFKKALGVLLAIVVFICGFGYLALKGAVQTAKEAVSSEAPPQALQPSQPSVAATQTAPTTMLQPALTPAQGTPAQTLAPQPSVPPQLEAEPKPPPYTGPPVIRSANDQTAN